MILLAKTFKGLEEVLADELRNLGATEVEVQRRAVRFEGDKALLYRANLNLRTASRVLMPILTFEAGDADEVYEQAKQIDWSRWMDVRTTFTIDSTVYSEQFRHSKYVTYRVKDAIADYWTEREGKRPNVNLTDPDLYINVHIADRRVTLSLDSSGESLHKRGYRVGQTEAPLNEALAAGMLLLAGWHGQCDFYDFMCGSGTLLIEAALIAQNILDNLDSVLAQILYTFTGNKRIRVGRADKYSFYSMCNDCICAGRLFSVVTAWFKSYVHISTVAVYAVFVTVCKSIAFCVKIAVFFVVAFAYYLSVTNDNSSYHRIR